MRGKLGDAEEYVHRLPTCVEARRSSVQGREGWLGHEGYGSQGHRGDLYGDWPGGGIQVSGAGRDTSARVIGVVVSLAGLWMYDVSTPLVFSNTMRMPSSTSFATDGNGRVTSNTLDVNAASRPVSVQVPATALAPISFMTEPTFAPLYTRPSGFNASG